VRVCWGSRCGLHGVQAVRSADHTQRLLVWERETHRLRACSDRRPPSMAAARPLPRPPSPSALSARLSSGTKRLHSFRPASTLLFDEGGPLKRRPPFTPPATIGLRRTSSRPHASPPAHGHPPTRAALKSKRAASCRPPDHPHNSPIRSKQTTQQHPQSPREHPAPPKFTHSLYLHHTPKTHTPNHQPTDSKPTPAAKNFLHDATQRNVYHHQHQKPLIPLRRNTRDPSP